MTMTAAELPMRSANESAERDVIEFFFDGRRVTARAGQSVAAALIESGERCLRIDEAGNPKGALCVIGVCWECRCVIDDVPNTRACMTPVTPGLNVRRQVGV